LGVFLTPYAVVLLLAPSVRKWSKDARVKAFVAGVTAAAAGAIAGAAFVLGRRAIIDLPTAAIGAATLLLLVKAKKIPEPLLIGAAGLVGLAVRGLR
jgi:chromate transporter